MRVLPGRLGRRSNTRNEPATGMAQRRHEIEAFVRHIVAEIEAAGATAPQAIADHLNANGVTTRKGRRWNRARVAKFLESPGAKRFRSGAKGGNVGRFRPNGNCSKPGGAE